MRSRTSIPDRLRVVVLTATLALVLSLAGVARASVQISSSGLGQVLTFPYYTVNDGYTTVFTVVNTTLNGKALKLRFHEAYDGRGVLDLNVYLAPLAVWSGAIVNVPVFCPANTPTGDCFSAALISSDSACTVPALSADVIPGGAPGLTFSPSSFAGANTDGGPTTNVRMAEGHFDVIEMGDIPAGASSQATLTAITPVNGVPPGCAQVVSAWASNGYWTGNANVDLAPPMGGLYGSEGIVDVSSGQYFSLAPEAITGFSSVIQHSAPGQVEPDLNSASAAGDGLFYASVGDAAIQAGFVRPVDAISALFMADTVYNTFDIEPSLGAMTDWVMAFPTKRYYVDPAIVGTTSVPPFTQVFGQSDGNSFNAAGFACQQVTPSVIDRNGAIYVPEANFGGVATPAACFEASVLTFGTLTSVLASNLTLNGCLQGCGTSQILLTGISDGHVIASLLPPLPLPSNQNCAAPLLASTGQRFCGLPVIGFSATNYSNDTIANGVLISYGASSRQHTHATCVTASGNPCD